VADVLTEPVFQFAYADGLHRSNVASRGYIRQAMSRTPLLDNGSVLTEREHRTTRRAGGDYDNLGRVAADEARR
jgi:hypothetical protein